MILIDTGPLVALFDKSDRFHKRCQMELGRIREPLLTTWPVLTEVMYLLSFSSRAQDLCLDFIESGGVDMDPTHASRLSRIHQLMHDYADLPMDFADASLVALAEDQAVTTMFTLDHKDFRIYRPKHTQRFRLIPETLR